MKAAVKTRYNYTPGPNIPYPNAATRQEIINKTLDLLIIGLMGAGAGVILLFLIALL